MNQNYELIWKCIPKAYLCCNLNHPLPSSVSELCAGASVPADPLHRLLCLRLGDFPLLLPSERRRHSGRCPSVDVPQERGRGWICGGDAGLQGEDGCSSKATVATGPALTWGVLNRSMLLKEEECKHETAAPNGFIGTDDGLSEADAVPSYH